MNRQIEGRNTWWTMWRWPHLVYKGWVHFFYQILQLLTTWRCSIAYRGITRRNYHTDTYAQEEDLRYQQKSFLWLSQMLIQLWPVELPLLKCQKVRNILPIQYHATLGFPVNHIVPISKPKEAIFQCLSQNDCHDWDVTTCMGHSRCL